MQYIVHYIWYIIFFAEEISANTFEYQPGPGVPVKKIVLPTGQSAQLV